VRENAALTIAGLAKGRTALPTLLVVRCFSTRLCPSDGHEEPNSAIASSRSARSAKIAASAQISSPQGGNERVVEGRISNVVDVVRQNLESGAEDYFETSLPRIACCHDGIQLRLFGPDSGAVSMLCSSNFVMGFPILDGFAAANAMAWPPRSEKAGIRGC